jgi:hypothetical protein
MLKALVRPGRIAWRSRDGLAGIDASVAQRAEANPPDGQGLALDDGQHPRDNAVGIDAVDVGEEDLDGALERVLGVVGADRETPRPAQEGGPVRREHCRGVETGGCCFHASVNPSPLPGAPDGRILGG